MIARFRSVLAALFLAALLITAAPAAGRAAPADAGAEGEAIPKGEAARDIFSPRLDLTIWTIVVFLGLLWVLGRFAWKPMLAGLKVREESIRGAMEEAKVAKEEAARLREDLKREMDKAQEQVRDVIDQAHRNAERVAAEMIAKGKSEIQADRDRFRRDLESARTQALKELLDWTAQLSTLAASKAVRRQLTPDDQHRLVEEALAELRGAAGERQREVASIT